MKKKLKNLSCYWLCRKEKVPQRKELIFIFVLGGVIGATLFFYLYGIKIINPTYLPWFTNNIGDPLSNYIGWEYYRNSPWSFPIGRISTLLYPYGSSVVFTDSIPLFAIPFKLISPILPNTFQYFGIWGLFTFVMQGGLAAILLRKFINVNFVCLLGSYFFIYSDPIKVKMFGHTALAGQFIILAGFCVWAYADRFKNQYKLAGAWGVVCVCASLIHPYFIVMTGVTLLGYIIQDYLINRNYKRCSIIFIVPLILSLFSFWQAGGFINMGNNLEGGSLEQASLNLNAFFNSFGSSKLLKALSTANIYFPTEGRQYLGLSVILLIPIMVLYGAKIIVKKRKQERKALLVKIIPFLFVYVVLLILALSPSIYLGDKLILSYKLPKAVEGLWGIFQSTGRLFWPVYYATILFALVALFRMTNHKKLPIFFVIAFILVQHWDTSTLFNQINARFDTKTEVTDSASLKSPFWDDVFERIKLIENIYGFDISQTLRMTFKSCKYATKTNLAYSARIPVNKLVQRTVKTLDGLCKGVISYDTLYVLQDKFVVYRILSEADKSLYSLYKIDDYFVLVKKGVINGTAYQGVKEVNAEDISALDYFNSFKDLGDNCMVMITATQEGLNNAGGDIYSLFHRFGLLKNLNNIQNKSYTAIFLPKSKKIISERVNENTEEVKVGVNTSINGYTLGQSVSASAKGNYLGAYGCNWFDYGMKLNGEIIFPNVSGINVSIYNMDTGKIEQIAWFSNQNEFKGKKLEYPYN